MYGVVRHDGGVIPLLLLDHFKHLLWCGSWGFDRPPATPQVAAPGALCIVAVRIRFVYWFAQAFF